MTNILAHLFTPNPSNNYKAKTLHLSTLSVFMIIIMFSQLLLTIISRSIPGVLGIASTITASELISLTNQQRQESGLAPLQLNQTLVNAASQKAGDMLAKNYWAHTSPDGTTPWWFFNNVGYRYLYAGENLARDFIDSQSVVNAWMNSPTHKDNLLSSRYQEVGIAVVHGNFQGQETTLVVQMFGTPVSSLLSKQPEQPVLAQPEPADQAVLSESQIVTPEVEIAELFPGSGLAEKFTQNIPILNSFNITKTMSITLTLILLLVIIIDTVIITKKRIVRLSGKGLAHLILLGILLILLLGIQPGLIL